MRSWSNTELETAVQNSRSYRQVLIKLRLKPAGGNYEQIKKYIRDSGLKPKFTGQGWRRDSKVPVRPEKSLEFILVPDTSVQSHKLKKRLFKEGLKRPKCEICGWAEYSIDGRLPLELDHINGNRHDNRLENLRILCPNCHSLQSTHRGKNIHLKRKPGWRNR